ncbi:MAG: hypothetical protein WA373_10365 [Burkholderiales bacterium]
MARAPGAAIDIGGTFTGLARYDADGRTVRLEKAPGTPGRPGDGVAERVNAAGGMLRKALRAKGRRRSGKDK